MNIKIRTLFLTALSAFLLSSPLRAYQFVGSTGPWSGTEILVGYSNDASSDGVINTRFGFEILDLNTGITVTSFSIDLTGTNSYFDTAAGAGAPPNTTDFDGSFALPGVTDATQVATLSFAGMGIGDTLTFPVMDLDSFIPSLGLSPTGSFDNTRLTFGYSDGSTESFRLADSVGSPGIIDGTSFSFTAVAIPEPGSLMLASILLVSFGGFSLWRKKRNV